MEPAQALICSSHDKAPSNFLEPALPSCVWILSRASARRGLWKRHIAVTVNMRPCAIFQPTLRPATSRQCPDVTRSETLGSRRFATSRYRLHRPARRAPSREDAPGARHPRRPSRRCGAKAEPRAGAFGRAQAFHRQESGREASSGEVSRTGSSGRPARGNKASCPTSWIRPQRRKYRQALDLIPHSHKGTGA
jgi:hypothetical protein